MEIINTELGLGSGIYTIPEAARLLRVSSAKVRGWAEGYVRHVAGDDAVSAPVLQNRRHQEGLLTFPEMIELVFVRAFRGAGVSLKDIRVTAQLLAREMDTAYPFANCKLNTDGIQLLRQADIHYHNMARQQHVFQFVEEFFKDIDFVTELAARWWPLGHEELIIIDPQRSFGAPIEKNSGIRTDVLYASYKAEDGDADSVAEWFEVPVEAVRSAVRFEEEWAKAA